LPRTAGANRAAVRRIYSIILNVEHMNPMFGKRALSGKTARFVSTFLFALALTGLLAVTAAAQSTPVTSDAFPPFAPLAALPDAPAREDGPLKIVASTGIIGDLVNQIGGSRVEVTTILPANADPHEFEPSPKDVATLQDANVVFIHGLGLDNWAQDLIDNSGADFSVVTVTDGVDAINRLGGDASDVDPHVWFDPTKVAQMTANIAAGLSAADPDGADAYNARLAVYQQNLTALDQQIAERVALIPTDRRNIVTNHDALGYFADRYGLNIVGTVIPGLSPGAEPSAQEVAALLQTVKDQQVSVIFAENTVSPKLAQELASEAGITVVDTLYSDSLGEAGSGADTYIGLMQTDTQTIVSALLSN
jgi:ABC-type Zn uptake system ZnuABC Zn-binding protein ZnuA